MFKQLTNSVTFREVIVWDSNMFINYLKSILKCTVIFCPFILYELVNGETVLSTTQLIHNKTNSKTFIDRLWLQLIWLCTHYLGRGCEIFGSWTPPGFWISTWIIITNLVWVKKPSCSLTSHKQRSWSCMTCGV